MRNKGLVSSPLYILWKRYTRQIDEFGLFRYCIMLCGHKKLLNTLSVVLASQSPRRQEILTNNLGFEGFTCIPSNFNEDIDKTTCVNAEEYVQRTCNGKMNDILSRRKELDIQPDLVISADTIVVGVDGNILEKPVDRSHAISMLSSLQGNKHRVMTAVTLGLLDKLDDNQYKIRSFIECTDVHFIALDAEEIEAYCDSGEPYDKAGGYGIQGVASSFVEKIEGDYFNVVGFPVHRFAVELLDVMAIRPGRASS